MQLAAVDAGIGHAVSPEAGGITPLGDRHRVGLDRGEHILVARQQVVLTEEQGGVAPIPGLAGALKCELEIRLRPVGLMKGLFHDIDILLLAGCQQPEQADP